MTESIISKYKNSGNLKLWVSMRNGTFDDISGNDNHPTNTGTIIKQSSKGYCGVFNGNDRLTFTTNPLAGLTNFTMAGWVYIDPTILNYGGAFGSAVYDTTVKGIDIRLESGTLFARIGNNSATGTSGVVPYVTSRTSSNWYHVVVTYDGTTQITYRDGVQVDSDVLAYLESSSSFYIGYDAINARYWKGKICDVMVFNGTLTASEVSQLYSETSKLKYSTKTSSKSSFKQA